MRLWWLVLFSLLLSTVASAQDLPEDVQEPAPLVTSRAVVPVIGAMLGVSELQWRTDVTIANPTPADLEIVMVMTGAPGEPFFMTTVPAGESIFFPDIAASTFGSPGFHGSLLVETLAPSSVLVQAIARGTRPGFETDPQLIRAIYGDIVAPAQLLSGLSFDEQYRTNIGVANVSDTDTVVFLSIQRILGRTLATAVVRVPARSVVHQAIQQLFPLLPEGRNFYLSAETESANTIVYASVLSNTSPDTEYKSGVLR